MSARAWARLVPAFVWGTLLVVLAHALLTIAVDGRNMPEAEDWHMVPPLTGREPDFLDWVWRPNAEHRVALSKLVYLGALRLAGGDFRAGAVLNTLLLAGLAAACVLTARALRGRPHWADAFFPLVFLNPGEANNYFWGWQLQYVLSVVLTVAPLLVMLRHGARAPLGATTAAALSMALLPLTGANGMIMAAALAPWYLLVVLAQRTTPRPDGGTARAAVMTAGLVVGLAFVALTLAQYAPEPGKGYANPGIIRSIRTALAFAAMGVGPAVWEHEAIVVLVLVPVVLGAGVLVLLRARASLLAPDDERWRVTGLVCFLGGCAVVTAAMGYGRAGWVPRWGMPGRYALLSAPTVVAAYYAWQIYGTVPRARTAQVALLVLSIFCLPANYRAGRHFVDWMRDTMDAVQKDIDAGVPRLELARRHRHGLLHWDEPNLARRIGMLRDAGIGPFARVPPDPAPP